MPENAGQATQWGVLLASLLAACGGLVTAFLNRRSSAQTTEEQGRQHDIKLIITTLQEQVKELRAEVKEAKDESAECLADRDQMRGELRRLRAQVSELQGNGYHGGLSDG